MSDKKCSYSLGSISGKPSKITQGVMIFICSVLMSIVAISFISNTASAKTSLEIIEFKNDRESWSNQSDRYSNFEYGFAWDFENHYGFEKVFPLEKHTIFRVEAKSGDLVAFVNIQKNVTQVVDSWDVFDVIKNNFHLVAEYTNDVTGEKMEMNNISKCSIAGQHAVKVEYTSTTAVDDVFKYEVIIQVTNYMIYNKDEVIILSVKAREGVCNKDEIDNIFKGFTFIVRYPL